MDRCEFCGEEVWMVIRFSDEWSPICCDKCDWDIKITAKLNQKEW